MRTFVSVTLFLLTALTVVVRRFPENYAEADRRALYVTLCVAYPVVLFFGCYM